MQMLLPIEVNSLISNSWNVPVHNKQLLSMVSAGACIVVPVWAPVITSTEAEQPASLAFQLASGEMLLTQAVCKTLCCVSSRCKK